MMQNRTDEIPSARMAVAKASLPWERNEAKEARIATQVCAAVKAGLPASDVVQWTNIDCFFSDDGCTVTVQGMARASVAWAARLGAGVAFAEYGDATISLIQEL